MTPYVWLDYDAAYPDLFGDANGGYATPIFFDGDTQRLAAGSEDVLITTTKDVYNMVTRLPPPSFRREWHELRFLKKELECLDLVLVVGLVRLFFCIFQTSFPGAEVGCYG